MSVDKSKPHRSNTLYLYIYMTQNTPESTIYLGFASQKGGVGKSSLAEALASILYYEKGIPLLVVDCDGTQESFFKLRERERTLIEDSKELSDQLMAHFTRFGKPAYPIIRSRPGRAIGDAEAFLRKTDKTAALVIFDFPGHAGAEELLELSIEMDYLISPIEADPQSLASGFAYAQTIRDLGVSFGDARIRDLLLLWNKINRSANMAVVDHYTRYAADESLNLFNARIYHSVRFARELGQGGVKGVFRSSYLPPARALRLPTGIDAWVEETIERLHLNPAAV